MNITYYKNKIKNLTLKQIFIKANKKVLKKILDTKNNFIDLNKDSRCINTDIGIKYTYINVSSLNISQIDLIKYKYLIDKYLSHEFDLLGSGWVKNCYNAKSNGVEKYKYRSKLNIQKFDREGNWIQEILPKAYVGFSKKIWNLVHDNYIPIDWQLDFKSGYRYNSRAWYKDQPIGRYLGVDIKVPWELSRMQHLPQMAIGAVLLKEYRYKIINEFKNEVLDFLAFNPPRIGCNWTCTMDVGIRISNILVAYDILRQLDDKNILDNKFAQILADFTYEHGEFIINNLEWNGDKSGNHYFSDISGLLFVASYLNRTKKTDTWLAFAIQEVIHCVKTQFYDDGSNFEASMPYHRLSGELALYDTSLIYGILNTDKIKALIEYNPKLIKRLRRLDQQEYNLDDKRFFPQWYIDKLFKCGCFTYDIMKSNNHIIQVGDNDSGRFFKFSFVGEFITNKQAYQKYYNLKNNKNMLSNPEEKYWDEDILNHSAFISAMNGLFDLEDYKKYSTKYPIEKSILECLARKVKFKYERDYKQIKIENKELSYLNKYKVNEIIFKDYNIGNVDLDSIKLLPYPDFGVYIFKSSKFFLSIFAGGNGQNGNGGHSHNDKLSFELCIDGKDLFIDPGTYLYTPMPNRRDEFRSMKAHNVPIVNKEEQNTFLHAFSMKNETKCSVLDYSNNSIKIYLEYRDIKITRELIIYKDKLLIKDACNKDFEIHLKPISYYSNGYGKIVINK